METRTENNILLTKILFRESNIGRREANHLPEGFRKRRYLIFPAGHGAEKSYVPLRFQHEQAEKYRKKYTCWFMF